MTITLTRRQVLELAMVGAAAAALPSVAVARKPVAGRILGLCTLDPADGRNEVSRLVELDLVTGAVDTTILVPTNLAIRSSSYPEVATTRHPMVTMRWVRSFWMISSG